MNDEKNYYIDKINSLEKDIEKLKSDLKQKCEQSNKILAHQSKMAAMGEMIGNIAHQWRQPLMELSSILISTEAKIKLSSSISNEEILEAIDKSNSVMKYMSSTIDDFRDFFAKDKEKSEFKISDQIKRALTIISSSLQNKNIKLSVIVKDNPVVYGFKNEYSQVLINIISNAKDVLTQREIEDAKIHVKVYILQDHCVTEVLDNGGGIKADMIEKIFEPFLYIRKKQWNGSRAFYVKIDRGK